jgi:hypothetical protein
VPFSGVDYRFARGFASLSAVQRGLFPGCWWFCFAGGVPVGPFRLVGSEAIGEGVIETLKKYPKSPDVLMQNHGPQQADVQWP